ncbi:TolC family protein, partial [uncultured Pseudoalteromonas sp.]
MKAKLISVSVAALMLSACNMAPDMEQRELPVAQNYDIQGTAGDINALNWQSFFSNAQLQQLIALTLENNKDIKTAALNVQQVRAMYQIEDSALYPSIDLNASGTRQRLPADLSGTGQATISENYSATVGLTAYEIDLWGKVRNQSEQALQNLYSAEYSLTSVRISLISELVNAWLNYATDKELLALANETLKSQQESLELTRKTFALGAASQLTL